MFDQQIEAIRNGEKILDLSNEKILDPTCDYDSKFESAPTTTTRLFLLSQNKLVRVSYKGQGVGDDGLLEVLDVTTKKLI